MICFGVPRRCLSVLRPLLWCVLTCFLLLALSQQDVLGQCGGDRWNVKTGLDPGAPFINLNSATATSIDSLTAVSHPATLPDNSRIAPTETTTWTLSATLIKYVKSYDADYHIVFQDSAGRTMIGEIPDPACVSSSSPPSYSFLAKRAAARLMHASSRLLSRIDDTKILLAL